MCCLDESKLHRIASHIICFKNQKARRNLIKANIDLKKLHKLSKKELNSVGFNKNDINNIKFNYREIAEKEIHKCKSNNISLIFKEDEFYPSLLSEIYDPPDFIYVMGDNSVLKTIKIAVVGSRRASPYGMASLRSILPDVCKSGLTVVSGMAYGIDSMSHEIAIEQGEKTIGVNAGGLLHLYPAGKRYLIDKIVENGCVISEFPMDVIPRPFYFPVRNRIISGISKSVLVVEAAFKSGSLITARLAIEQNRDVYAVPGRIDSHLSEGTHYLIQQGAKLITSSKDIFDDYGIEYKKGGKKEPEDLSLKEKKILDLIKENEVKDIDYFVENLDISVSEIISLLMGMILKNIIIEEEGGYRKLI